MNDQRLARLESDIQDLKDRLSRLERASQLPQPESVFSESPEFKVKEQDWSQVLSSPISSEEKSTEWGSLLAVTAVICFVLAGAFLIRLAIESGWLTPLRQWGLVILLGASLAGAGRFVSRIDLHYRGYLSAAGVIVLYMAAFSSSVYFNLTDQGVSLLLGMAVTGVGLGLFHYHRSELFPIIVATGTYLAPLVLGGTNFDLLLTSGYFLLWSALFGWFAAYFESRTLLLVSSYLGIGAFAAHAERVTAPEGLLTVILVLCGQFVLLSQGVLRQSIVARRGLTEQQAWSLFPALCFFYGVTYFFLNRLAPAVAPWIALCFAAFLLGLERRGRRALGAPDGLASKEMVGAFLVIVLFHAGYLQLMPSGAKAWLLPLVVLARYITSRKSAFPRMAKAFNWLGLAVGGIELLKTIAELMFRADSSYLPSAIVTLVLGWLYYLDTKIAEKNAPVVFLGGIHALAMIVLYRLFWDTGSVGISIAWGVYASLILGLGFARRDSLMARSSLVVLLAASLKALLYDAAMAPAGVRVICLLVTGALLYGSGLLFRQMANWASEESARRPIKT